MRVNVAAEALFASSLQPSDHPTREEVRRAIRRCLAVSGLVGCVAVVATEYGEHPDSAVARMSWALSMVDR